MNAAPRAVAAPPAVTALNEGGASRFVLLCEHASNVIPAEYAALGLPAAELERHIAYDIGAAKLARRLSGLLDAPLFLAGASRLLIDLNRPWRAPSSIPEVSEATVIPGNIGIDAAERARRQAAWFTPFHDRVAAFLETRPGAVVIGVHSFTPVYLGEVRPWHAGILYGEARRFGTALVQALAADPALVIGDNEPYRIELDHDYTVPVHGDAAGRDAVLLEVRQDLLGDDAGCEDWAVRLAAALQ
jgi:predicted N-formylglutamate amidohydrolase